MCVKREYAVVKKWEKNNKQQNNKKLKNKKQKTRAKTTNLLTGVHRSKAGPRPSKQHQQPHCSWRKNNGERPNKSPDSTPTVSPVVRNYRQGDISQLRNSKRWLFHASENETKFSFRHETRKYHINARIISKVCTLFKSRNIHRSSGTLPKCWKSRYDNEDRINTHNKIVIQLPVLVTSQTGAKTYSLNLKIQTLH